MNSLPKGVYLASKKDNSIYYRASITFCRKHISLGSFSSVGTAHAAYLEADRILHDKSISIDSHVENSPLHFEKWVSLINFRDNGIYLSTPIYVRPNYFFYYLSPGHTLLFDSDELFFYSSHKIMKRNKHLFVADYGMQISILSRYGIRSYSVPGKDYYFINGDDSDFRRQNLKIVNLYAGVTTKERKGRQVFQAKINIPGYYVIGYYRTAIEAAIAYNKAIDILKRNGCTRNYTANYIDSLSGSEYANIYAHLKISDKLQQLRF